MFSFGSTPRRTGDAPSPASSGHASTRKMLSVLGADVIVSGNIEASADLHIEGRVEGNVDCATLLQGADSIILGAVNAETARLAGRIEGSVAVRQLTIERAARIIGDVAYDTITIELGAVIDGRLQQISTGSDQGAGAGAMPPALAGPATAMGIQLVGSGSAA